MKIYMNPNYKKSESVRFNYFKDDILNNLDNKDIVNLLDVGSFQFKSRISFKNISYYAIDLKIPEDLNKNHFKVCDLNKEKIPFEDNFFDFVIAGEIIEHIKRPFDFLDELRRVTKKNGKIYLSTPNPYYYIEILKELFGIKTLDDKEHLTLFPKNHLISYCKDLGLDLVKFKRYKFWIPGIKLMYLNVGLTPNFFNYQNIYIFKKRR